MISDLMQLELNVNLHSLQPGFDNQELHYVFAKDQNSFRFGNWDDQPEVGETKYYCYLVLKDLYVPAGNISLRESYSLSKEPPYSIITDPSEILNIAPRLTKNETKKCIKHFHRQQVDNLIYSLHDPSITLQKHLVQSEEAKHLVLVIGESEVSVSRSMVYFRHRAPFSLEHYDDVMKEGDEQKHSANL